MSSLIRKSWLGRALLDDLPVGLTLPDGTRRRVSRGMARMAGIWSRHEECVDESRGALEAYSGGDLVDVGAFHGWYSVLLSARMGAGDRSVSLEPDLRAQPVLLRHLSEVSAWRPDVQLIALPLAVGDGSAIEARFHDGTTHPSFVSRPASPGDRDRSVTIDELVDAMRLRPGLVKIDVEGAESYVLDGMTRTLAGPRPTLMLEVHPRWQPEDRTVAQIDERLTRAGYRKRVLADADLARRELWTPA